LREQIELLASLQKVDREIKEKSETKAVLSGEVRRREEEIQAKQAEVSAVRSEWEEKERLRREKERLLQEESRKTMERRMRMSRIKNIRELQALQREIDQIKQNNALLEEELLKLMEELEASAASFKEKEEGLKKLEQEWDGRRSEMEAQMAEIDRLVADSSTVRHAIATQLNADLIKRYELIFSRRGGIAVVAVSEGTCQGCYMNLPPQLWNEIIRSDKLILCPSCHRILYHSPTLPGDKQL